MEKSAGALFSREIGGIALLVVAVGKLPLVGHGMWLKSSGLREEKFLP
jgi:hypothetical protein